MKNTSISEGSYDRLLQEILQNIQKSTEEITRNKLEMCWNIGRLVQGHLLKNEGESYGNNLIKRLEEDAKISRANLYRMRGFYQAYPKLPKNDPRLNWTHYKILSGTTDPEERKQLENLTKKNAWSSSDLQKNSNEVKKLNLVKNTKKKTKLTFSRGKLFTYKIAEIDGEKFLDLGFNIFQEFSGKFADGEIVESTIKSSNSSNIKPPSLIEDAIARLNVNSDKVSKSDKFSFKKSDATTKEMHTYKASIQRVVDGDTIRVSLDLGFGVRHKEILRLSKINAPERKTKEGETSTKKLQEILSDVKTVIIKTNKTDIYGRYIADVFLDNENGKYLNQMLIDAGVVMVF